MQFTPYRTIILKALCKVFDLLGRKKSRSKCHLVYKSTRKHETKIGDLLLAYRTTETVVPGSNTYQQKTVGQGHYVLCSIACWNPPDPKPKKEKANKIASTSFEEKSREN